MNKKKVYSTWFLVPALTIFLVFFIIPMVTSLFFSLTVWDLKSFTFCGLDNFKTFFGERSLSISVRNTLIYAFMTSGLKVVIAFFIALFLTSKIRTKNFLRALVFFPNLVSAVALATMWLQYVYSSKFGLLKSILDAVGMHKLAETAWLDTGHKFGALLFAYCFGMIGYHMLIWMSGIERISPELYEAATIDGANRPQQFQHMTLPLLKGVFKTNITMWSVSTVAFFVWSQMFSTVTADEATIVPVQYMYMQTFGAGNAVTERNAGYGAAIGIILCICIVVIFTICNKLIKEDDLEF